MSALGVKISALELSKRRRVQKLVLVLAVLIVLTFMISMITGVIKLSAADLLRTLAGMGTDRQNLILFDFRMPRIVISVLIGAGLSVSGCIMQGISRNALADPGILGINSGAGFVMMMFITFYSAPAAAPIFLLPVLAWLGAGLMAVLIYSLAYKPGYGLLPTRLLLTGIAAGSGIGSVTLVLTLRLDPEKYQFAATWMAGNIWGANWKFVAALLPFIIVLLPIAFYKARVLNVLNMGDYTAKGLGLNAPREQMALLAVAVGLAGSCVAVSGLIGFVGLIGPHLGRRLIGPRHQALLPVSALIGSLLVLMADTLGRWIVAPSEIPAGIVVAAIGAPYFLYLLAQTRKTR